MEEEDGQQEKKITKHISVKKMIAEKFKEY